MEKIFQKLKRPGEFFTGSPKYNPGFLFNSLYSEAQAYKKVVELLSSKMIGMTRSEMMSNLKLLDNGFFSIVLDNLEKCDFIRHYQSFGKRRNEALYQLTDMFTLFFVRFVKNYNGMDENAWSHLPDGKRNAWQGYAYEQVCIHHINQIKKALGISGIASDVCSWTKKGVLNPLSNYKIILELQ